MASLGPTVCTRFLLSALHGAYLEHCSCIVMRFTLIPICACICDLQNTLGSILRREHQGEQMTVCTRNPHTHTSHFFLRRRVNIQSGTPGRN